MLNVPWLESSNIDFPSTELAFDEPSGLLAVGGDLSTERLINAYRHGIFPWYEEPQPILWWSPNPRAVLFPKDLIVSRSLKKRLKRQEYRVTCDQQFQQVMLHCMNVTRSDQDGTWINNSMIGAYTILHNMGFAHSIEVWNDNDLIGGLYGIALGKVFFGESMFSLRTDASKVGLAHLCHQLDIWGFAMLDCQVSSPHIISLGAKEIQRSTFETLLKANVDIKGEPQGVNGWTNNWTSHW